MQSKVEAPLSIVRARLRSRTSNKINAQARAASPAMMTADTPRTTAARLEEMLTATLLAWRSPAHAPFALIKLAEKLNIFRAGKQKEWVASGGVCGL